MSPATSEFPVRRLGPEDAVGFRDIRLEALRQEPEHYASAHADWCDRPLADFEQLLENVRYVAAEADSGLVGIVGWYPKPSPATRHRGELVAVYVRPEWRRRGLFGRMMQAILADARGRVRQLELHVAAGNAPALAAYRAQGFEQIGRIPDALCHGGRFADELLMLRRIAA